MIADANAVTYFPSPLKQVSDDLLPEHVTCNEGLSLIIKIANGSPACVNHASIEKLIQREWGIKIFDANIAQKAQSIWDHFMQQQKKEFYGEYIDGPTENGYEITQYKVVGNTMEKIFDYDLPSDLVHI
ncbi:MAG: hypothetical protein GKS07_03275 [Nitrosopumilus sp.]|nr:MAG: hypothetical protein GKS07_03275 [Nitrosopumilus sp.]